MKYIKHIPNILTIIRFIFVPFIIVALALNNYILAFVLFTLSSISDILDGYIARKYNAISDFGKLMDPLADKLLVTAALISLVELHLIPSWAAVIIIAREFAVSGYRLIAVEKNGTVIAANKWGKIKTVTQMIAIILAYLDTHPFGAIFTMQLQGFEFIMNLLVTLFMIICTIATIFSGYEYLKGGKDLLKDM